MTADELRRYAAFLAGGADALKAPIELIWLDANGEGVIAPRGPVESVLSAVPNLVPPGGDHTDRGDE